VDGVYAGFFVGPYLYAFSYEPQDGHDAETHAALNLAPGVQAPAGGAVVAARLALYAALIKGGAAPPPGAPSADQAAALAKRILLAWADRGFPRTRPARFWGCRRSPATPAARLRATPAGPCRCSSAGGSSIRSTPGT
jgi:hypothetical protein